MSARLLIDQWVSRWMADAVFAPIAVLVYVGDVASGAPDEDVLALARRENCILVTEDYDFGRLIFGERAPPPRGAPVARAIPCLASRSQSKIIF